MATLWITGAHGFIGRHLASYLSKRGHRVYGIGHGIWPQLEAEHWGIHGWVNGEIDGSNLECLNSKSGEPDWLFHLAGGATVGGSFANPLEDFSRTVSTTARLLDWLRAHVPRCRVIAVSSAAVYGSGHTGCIPESASPAPYSPYGYHKMMMEELCNSYAANFGLQIAVVRLFSVYGAWLQKQLLWDLCSRIASGAETLHLGGTGEERRDWTSVKDVVRLLEFAASSFNSQTRLLNGGTGVPTTVREISELVIRAWPTCARPVFSGESRAGDPFSLVADAQRLSALGFRCEVDVASGIRSYVEWFRKHWGQSLNA